jgi:hypothetical protein
MAAGFEKDESLLRDSEDWRSKMPSVLEASYQPGFLKACQPPTQRPHVQAMISSDNRLAQLIETDGPRVPHMQQTGTSRASESAIWPL